MPASVHSHPDVHLALVARGQQWLANERLVLVAREVFLEAALVDLEAAAPGAQDHARDRGLSLAGGLDSRLAGQLHCGLARRHGLLATLGRGLGLKPRPLLGLGLDPRPLLGGELALGLDRDRLELGSRRTLVLGIGIGILGGLARGFDLLGRLGLRLLLIPVRTRVLRPVAPRRRRVGRCLRLAGSPRIQAAPRIPDPRASASSSPPSGCCSSSRRSSSAIRRQPPSAAASAPRGGAPGRRRPSISAAAGAPDGCGEASP